MTNLPHFGFIRMGIFHKLLLTLIILMIIPLGGLWYISNYQSERVLSTNLGISLIRHAEALSSRVDDWLDMNLRVLQQNASLPDVMSMEATLQLPILRSMKTAYPWIDRVVTFKLDGRTVASTSNDLTEQHKDWDYFQRLIAGDEQGIQLIQDKIIRKPILVLARPITDNNRQRIGVIAMLVTLNDVAKFVADVKIGSRGFAILLDQTGAVVTDGRMSSAPGDIQYLSDHPALKTMYDNSTELASFQLNNEKFFAFGKRTHRGWGVIVQQSYDDVFAPIREVRHTSIVVVLITIVVVLIGSYVLSNRVSAPILRLTKIADSMSRNQWQGDVLDAKRGDEIGSLARAIDRMYISVQMAMERLRSKQNE